jgi:hypothetical protein
MESHCENYRGARPPARTGTDVGALRRTRHRLSDTAADRDQPNADE